MTALTHRLAVVALSLAACGPGGAAPDTGYVLSPDVAANPPDATAPDALPTDGATTTPAEQAAFSALLTDAQRILAAGHTPGASLAVVLHGRLAFAAGVGLRDTAQGTPVTTSTLFRVASMSKMIVAATAMSLARDGTVDLHAPITRYAPWFELGTGFDASTLTLDALLSHSSGFPCDTIPQCGATSSGPRQAFFAAHPQPLWSPPGAVFDYSNTGFALAATVLANAAGMPDSDFVQLAHDRVFVPAGMTTATYDVSAAEATGDYATGYDVDAAGAVTGTDDPAALACPLLDPPGGVMATATDYAHFAEALLAGGGRVLDAAGVAAMEGAHIDTHDLPSRAYGYALFRQLSPYPDHESIWHDGSLPGFLSMLWLVPDAQFAVVVLVNARGNSPVTSNLVGAALGRFIPESRVVPPFTTDPSRWTGYAGTYNDPYGTLGMGVTITVVSTGASPSVTIDAPDATDFAGHAAPVHGAMTQSATDQWSLPDGTLATFFPDATGVYRYLATRRGTATR